MHLADLVPDDPPGVDAVPVVVTLPAYQCIDVAIDLAQRHTLVDFRDYHRPVLGQIVHQLLEYPVGAQAARVTDVSHIAVPHRRAIQDERHVLRQLAGGGEEVQGSPETAKRGAVPKPRERCVEPVLNSPLDQVLAKAASGLPLGDAWLQRVCDRLRGDISQLL